MDEDDAPIHGYGRFDRPLGNDGDRDAESIRTVLRAHGFADFNDSETGDGYSVEGGYPVDGEPGPFFVSYCGDTNVAATVAGYAEALRSVGWHVNPAADDKDRSLEVRPRFPST